MTETPVRQTTSGGPRTVLAVREGARLAPAEGACTVSVSTWETRIPVGDEAVRDVVVGLMDQPLSSAEVLRECMAASTDQMTAAMTTQKTLHMLQMVGALQHVLVEDGRTLARLTTSGAMPTHLRAVPKDDVRRSLSPLAVAEVRDGLVMVQSGASHLRVEMAPEIFAKVVAGEEVPAPVLDMLHTAELWITEEQASSRGVRQWSARDLWFHRAAHDSRSNDRYGGSYVLAEEFEPVPFDRPEPGEGRRIALPTPDLDAARESDPRLVDAIEKRHSTRTFLDEGMSLDELGELLYRSARVRNLAPDDMGLELVDRPYPSGGSIHELEIYLSVTNVDGLAPGLYRYAPLHHALDLINDSQGDLAKLNSDAMMAIKAKATPPVVLFITSRFSRLMWKYETMALALTLKHVGVLYQTLYLNATAIGLGICGIGGGATSTFARATGIDSLDEGVVGMLVLGRPSPDDEDPWRRS